MATESNNSVVAQRPTLVVTHVSTPVVAQMPTPLVTPIVPAVHHREKPEKFNGLNFKM